MLKLAVFSVGLGILSILSACATLNENECSTVNWQQLGDSDGGQGFGELRIAKHVKACEKFNIPVDRVSYGTGWRAGIARFCIPQNGFSLGIAGKAYRNSCPSELAGSFLDAYQPAKRFHDAEKRVRALESSINFRITEISRLAGSKDPKDIKRLREESDTLKWEQNSLPRARADAQIARQNVTLFLQQNPDIRAF